MASRFNDSGGLCCPGPPAGDDGPEEETPGAVVASGQDEARPWNARGIVVPLRISGGVPGTLILKTTAAALGGGGLLTMDRKARVREIPAREETDA